jgi:hypothetical protein
VATTTTKWAQFSLWQQHGQDDHQSINQLRV